MKLQDFASVRSGLVLSRMSSDEPTNYKYSLINLRCIRQEGRIDLGETDVFNAKESLREEYLSHKGDIIVRLTAPYTAVLIDESTEGMVVPSNIVIIHIEDKRLLPEYLFWFLNTKNVKKEIFENSTSNMLGAVKATFLNELEIAVLTEKKQHLIAQINLLAKKENQLVKELADEKEKYYTVLLDKIYKESKARE